jgi:hypothetical protein
MALKKANCKGMSMKRAKTNIQKVKEIALDLDRLLVEKNVHLAGVSIEQSSRNPDRFSLAVDVEDESDLAIIPKKYRGFTIVARVACAAVA